MGNDVRKGKKKGEMWKKGKRAKNDETENVKRRGKGLIEGKSEARKGKEKGDMWTKRERAKKK